MTRTALTFAGAIATTAALAAPAHAGVLTKSATGCDDPVLSQPFKAWLDNSSYKPVQNGNFEAGDAGWTLTGGAKVVDGNASQHVGGAADSRSLLLPAGSSATSAPVCVGLNEPTLRYFARKNSGLLSTLLVQVQVQLELGVWVTLPVGVDLGGAWHPSLPSLVVANLLPLLPPDMTAVRFKFSPLLGGAWQIDDVYVDPRVSH
ncbi:hypothetical protein OM076_21620 [Solirubrobacter ginsenosidimutans]|uniref:Uncharacterized protein n=1 Tax=Solirubrobacter ginsenosidimutans TaxID=490573 RepID=A0A9X3S304_9ACTN|nr:hypothetical protein [Solirubrobacter ginsenosidimutans]MDA0162887.1 hypothetical protein [Solirubrobacter ginsenosidimutans]